MGTMTQKVMADIDKEELEELKADEPKEDAAPTEEAGGEERATDTPDSGESDPESEAATDADDVGDDSEKDAENAPTEDTPEAGGDDEKGKEEPRSLVVTVEGEEIEISEEEAIAGYQRAKTSMRRFQEAAQKEKQAQAALESILKNPVSALRGLFTQALGGDRQKAEEAIFEAFKEPVGNHLQMLFAPEEEKKKRTLEMEKQRLEEDIEAMNAEKASQEESTRQVEYAQQLDREIGSALKETSLPKEPAVIKRICDLMASYIQGGYQDVTPLEVAQIVREERAGQFKEVFNSMSEEELLEKYPEQAERISRAVAEKIKNGKAPTRSTGKRKAVDEDGQPTKRRRRGEPQELFGTTKSLHKAMLEHYKD